MDGLPDQIVEFKASQLIKWYILKCVYDENVDNPDWSMTRFREKLDAVDITNIDEIYQELLDDFDGWDEQNAYRCSGVETNLDGEFSRHYESELVARNIYGKWVGWTYWHGGGKWGNDEEVPWLEDAVYLKVVEEREVSYTERTFDFAE